MVGGATRVMMTSSKDGLHAPLPMVHRNRFCPIVNPVTPEVGLLDMVTAPLPLITVHAPNPIIGTFPFNVVLLPQTI